MKIANQQFDFLQARQVAMTNAELQIPETPPYAGPNQGYALVPDDLFTIYSPGHNIEGHFIVRGWIEAAQGLPRQVDLENRVSHARLYLTAWQIGTLEHEGRMRPVFISQTEEKVDGNIPGLALILDDRRKASADVKLGFAVACFEAPNVETSKGFGKKAIMDAAREYAAKIGTKMPTYNTLKRYMYEYRDHPNDPLRALADKVRRGNPGSRFGSIVEEMVEQAVEAAWRLPKGSWRTVRAECGRILEAKQAVGELPKNIDPDELIPSNRTLQRRFSSVNRYDKIFWRYGPVEADRRMSRYVRQMLPDNPLDIVDVDHCTLPVVVIDDRFPVAYGKPDLIVFRDRKTGSVLGYSISFDNPSYESFLHALRHAMFPKDMSAYPGLSWDCYGRFSRLGVDNALHFLGDNITNAGKQLGFQITEYRPGKPWEKGALERLFGIFGQQVFQNLPGSTTSSPNERDRYDPDRDKALPKLLLSELEAFFVDYICNIYHKNPQSGLGFLRTLSGVPEVLWKEANLPNRVPVDPDIFVRLAGDVNSCTIQDLGIRLDHIFYQSEELLAVTAHPDHKEGAGRHAGTKYQVIRDPNNLRCVWLVDPYRNVIIEVPACSADMAYANGLRLFQHRKIIKYWQDNHGQPENATQLLQGMNNYQLALLDIHQQRKLHKTASKIAKFVSRQGRKLGRSSIVEAVTSAHASSDRLDVANPLKPAPMERYSPHASKTRPRTKPHDTTVATYSTNENGVWTAQDPVPVAAERPRVRAEPTNSYHIETLSLKHKGYD